MCITDVGCVPCVVLRSKALKCSRWWIIQERCRQWCRSSLACRSCSLKHRHWVQGMSCCTYCIAAVLAYASVTQSGNLQLALPYWNWSGNICEKSEVQKQDNSHVSLIVRVCCMLVLYHEVHASECIHSDRYSLHNGTDFSLLISLYTLVTVNVLWSSCSYCIFSESRRIKHCKCGGSSRLLNVMYIWRKKIVLFDVCVQWWAWFSIYASGIYRFQYNTSWVDHGYSHNHQHHCHHYKHCRWHYSSKHCTIRCVDGSDDVCTRAAGQFNKLLCCLHLWHDARLVS